MKLVLCIFLAFAVLVCASLSPLQAQNANATIKGTVTDPSGAAVAGAARGGGAPGPGSRPEGPARTRCVTAPRWGRSILRCG